MIRFVQHSTSSPHCSAVSDDLELGLNHSSPPPYFEASKRGRSVYIGSERLDDAHDDGGPSSATAHDDIVDEAVDSESARAASSQSPHKQQQQQPAKGRGWQALSASRQPLISSPLATSPPMTPEDTSSRPGLPSQSQQRQESQAYYPPSPPVGSNQSPLSPYHQRSARTQQAYGVPHLPPAAPVVTALSIPDTIRIFAALVDAAWCIAVPILWTTLGRRSDNGNSMLRAQLTGACGIVALLGILVEIGLSVFMARRRARRRQAVRVLRRTARGWCAERGVGDADLLASLHWGEGGERVGCRVVLAVVVGVVFVLMVLVGFVLS